MPISHASSERPSYRAEALARLVAQVWRPATFAPGRLAKPGPGSYGHIYGITDAGIAECFELKTGSRVWSERLQGRSSRNSSCSSMLLAEGKIYIPNQPGDNPNTTRSSGSIALARFHP